MNTSILASWKRRSQRRGAFFSRDSQILRGKMSSFMSYDRDESSLFDDDDEDQERDSLLDADVGRELLIYMIDASPEMFLPFKNEVEDGEEETYFNAVVKAVTKDMKTRIISRDRDEVAICFFNTRVKKNFQESEGVFVFQASDQANQDELCQPTARLIKDFSNISETFDKDIGSKAGVTPGSRENPLYNALWIAQGLLRKGSVKNSSKRILLFTNVDYPFSDADPAFKKDMRRTTVQRARDAQDLGIVIDCFPLSKQDKGFDIGTFYADMVDMSEEEKENFMAIASDRFESMVSQMQKRLFKKRTVRRLTLTVPQGMKLALQSFALFRPATPGTTAWVDSFDNKLLKSERSFLCSDTGALLSEPLQRFQEYKSEKVCFSLNEVAEVRKITETQLQLLGFKPLECLQEYHNLRPSTFLYPDEERITGSTSAFVALYRAMLCYKKYGVAFLGSNCRMVALVAQAEVSNEIGQVEPPGIHMIYLPYSDDIRHIEKMHGSVENTMPQASNEQIEKATAMIKKLDLKDFTYANYSNPALQRHYAILEAVALKEDDFELADPKDDTLPPEEQMQKLAIAQLVKAFKDSVYGPDHDLEEQELATLKAKGSATAQKRKAAEEMAGNDYDKYDWNELADKGKLKDLTISDLKIYLLKHKLQVTGKKDILINRILTQMGKSKEVRIRLKRG
ncbi:hypothetical protein GOP47_0001653 [Adiantum capillus-veneris]|uniref:Ku domain-containing protein n=1 Tax=Adiantum capillus-veneris TaxID=13818 RepID=A0A9D4ZQW8_ADICA|nr:hypothetical protein GOP47_0001653 [Adiantum capillus-veneris]